MGVYVEAEWSEQSYVGQCNVCGWEGTFERKHRAIRETFECKQCRSTLRYRGQAASILDAFGRGHKTIAELANDPTWRSLDIYEPGIIGPFRRLLKEKPYYLQSFFWEDVPLGQKKDGLVCENLEKTTFPDERFNLVITSDIFEHIRRPEVAFSEIRRILKRGGRHIFTVPAVDPMPAKTVKRVDASGETDVMLLPEVYHGSGVAGGRSLVYTDFGIDILDMFSAMDFPTIATVYRPNPAVQGIVTFTSTRI